MNPTPPKKNATAEEIIIVPAKAHKSEISFKQGASNSEDDVLNITISKSKKDKKNKLKRAQAESSTSGPISS
jgi:hypothetical protein